MFWKKTMLMFLAILLFCGAGNAGVGYAADEISRLVLSKNEVTLEMGDSAALTATAVYVSGKTEDVTITTDWTSQGTEIAAAYAGRITAKAEGTTTVTATYMGKSVVVAVTVTKKVKALTLDKQTLNVLIDDATPAQLVLTALYSDGQSENVTTKADWSIDNASIATVINGQVKGLNSGTGIITAKYGSQTTTIPVNVEIAHRLEPSKSQVSLLLGGSETVALRAIYPDGSETPDVAAKAEWSSDNPAVADALKGKITAYGAGTATITATYGTKTATIAVDVDTTQKLEVNKQSIFLHAGETSDIALTATYANGDGTPVNVSDKAEWSSDKENVAYYSNGKIHAVASGAAVITAEYGGKSVQIQVDVEVPRALDIVPSYLTMKSGTTETVKVKASFAGATASEDITSKVTWSSDNEDVVFAKDGTISAYKAGSATITAAYGGKTASLAVDVDVPQSLTADVTTVAIPVGGAKQVTITAAYPDGTSENVTQKVTWASNATAVATVRQGLITGVATGAASITATFGNRTVTIPVSVGVLQTLTVDKKKLVMSNGKSETVTLTATYADGTTKNVNEQAAWTSASAAVAEVSQGKITATGSGKTTITATFDGKTVSIAVEVDQATTLSVDPRLLILTVNESADIKLTATDSAGNTSNVASDAEWSSSAIKIADVVNGRVTGLTNGRATITAKYGGKSVAIPVEVGIVTKLEADKRYASIKSNSATQITLTATFADGRTMDVTSFADWKTSNYKVVDVAKGLITGRAYGKATITAKYNDKSVSVPVDVDTLKYLKTDVVQLVMAKGETKQVTATATYMDGSELNVTKPALWTTSRLLVADVKDGVIKATGSGKATIYVTYGGKKTPIVVTVR